MSTVTETTTATTTIEYKSLKKGSKVLWTAGLRALQATGGKPLVGKTPCQVMSLAVLGFEPEPDWGTLKVHHAWAEAEIRHPKGKKGEYGIVALRPGSGDTPWVPAGAILWIKGGASKPPYWAPVDLLEQLGASKLLRFAPTPAAFCKYTEDLQNLRGFRGFCAYVPGNIGALCDKKGRTLLTQTQIAGEVGLWVDWAINRPEGLFG